MALAVWACAIHAQCPLRRNVAAPEPRPDFPRVVLAESVEFPDERLPLNKRGLSVRVVASIVTRAPGAVVELLCDAGPGAQIADPLTGRVVWVAKSKLGGPAPVVAPREPDPSFTPHAATSTRPIRFPLRHPDGSTPGSTMLPSGQAVQVIDKEGDFVHVQVREHAGWVTQDALRTTNGTPATATLDLPQPGAPTPPEILSGSPSEPPPRVPFKTSKSHAYIDLVPLTLTAEVLRVTHYPTPGQQGGFWTTEVRPADFVLAWGPAMRSGSGGGPLAEHFRSGFSLIVDDPVVRKQVRGVKAGDIVRLEGSLIHLVHPRDKADPTSTSLTGAFGYVFLCRAVHRNPEDAAAVWNARVPQGAPSAETAAMAPADAKMETAVSGAADARPSDGQAPAVASGQPADEMQARGAPTGAENVRSSNYAFELDVLKLTNEAREAQSVPALLWSDSLARAARFHAAHMGANGYSGHDTLLPGGRRMKPPERIGLFDPAGAGENIAQGQRTPSEVMKTWLASHDQRRNIMSPDHKRLGVGYVNGHWVQVFGQ